MRLKIATAASIACLLSSSPVLSQDQPDRPAAADRPTTGQAPATETVPAIEQPALDALSKMGEFLKSLGQFEITSDTTTEYVLDDGQKVMLAGTATIKARRPDRFLIDVASDRKVRQFYYDGETLTVFSPRQGFYAVVDAPPTIRETLDAAYQRYGIALPLQDVFQWGDPEAKTSEFQSAIWVGPAKLGDTVCDQYAYRTADADLQLWIARGDEVLPRKIVITSRGDPALPQYVATLDWRLDPNVTDETFVFTPPSDAQQIAIASNEP
jgi:hypothetical protein